MSDRPPSTAPTAVSSTHAPFWSVIRRALLWGAACGAVLAVAVSIASTPLAAVLFPVYLVAGAVVGLLGSFAGILVALGAWSALRATRCGVRVRAIGAAAVAAIAVPLLWAWALLAFLSPTNPDGASAVLVAAVAAASIVIATLLCRRFLGTKAVSG
ncbi:hypothetical protein [Labedella endophytica]|uniref:hypothetical protein n=1 Tax=Labedella endophytica TaxID=1523160 RepID=UPI00140A41A8|nr:hypothetical protein [Labedella endophytica]